MGVLRRPFVWIPLLLVALFAVAVIGSYTLLPGLVRSQATAYVDKNLPGKTLTLGDITFDPWTLTLDIADIAIADAKAPRQPLVALDRLRLDASLSSLWKAHPRLDAVAIDAPSIDAVLRKDGSINLAELVPPDDGTPIPEVWIGDLQVAKGRLFFTDDRRARPERRRLEPVAFSLKNFATTASDGGGFTFDATSDNGERLAWAGTMAMAPVASAGTFSFGALKLTTIGRLAGDLLPAELTGGSIDLAGRYRFALPPAARAGAPVPRPQFDADLTALTLADAAITASTGDQVAIRQLTIAPTKISLSGDALVVGEVEISGIGITRPGGERAAITKAKIAATRYGIQAATADIGPASLSGISVTGRGRGAETVALAGLAVGPSRLLLTPQQAEIGALTVTGLRLGARVAPDNSVTVPGLYPLDLPAPAPAKDHSWKIAVAGVDLTDAALRVTVARPAPVTARTFNLAPLTLKLGAFDSGMAAPLAVDLATRVNGTARIGVTGTASPNSGTADLQLDLAGLPLAELATLAPPNAVLVKAGTMAVKGRLKVAGTNPDFNGKVGVSNLDLVQRTDGSALLTWKQLDMTGIRYTSAPQRLAIARVAFDRANSRVTITRDAKLNLATVAGVETPSLGGDAPAAAPAAKTITVAAPVSNTLNAAGKLFPVTIGEVAVRDSTIGFQDLSIDPNFAASIQGFNGRVTGLSTAPASQATFDLKGYVIDRYAPVTITGRANVFAYDADTDLTASFRNIELPVFNPYSGRFAGYAISKGKLSTTLHYRINNRALQADHKVVLDQLTWGEATDSKQKVSLPIRLATSLLKDKNGVIDLDVPVGGTLDDPSFKVWPIVWQVVGNIFTKLITAPFALIGGLFGGGPDAQFVDFAPGLALLPPEADKSLKAVAKGLGEKLEINLDIPAGPGIREDGEAMTTARLHAAVLAGKKGPVADDYASLDPGKRADRLKSLYKAKFGKGPKFPDELPSAGMLAGGEAKAAAATAQIAWLEEQLRPKFAPADADLAALGQARADAVKQALLAEGTLDPTRVFIATDKAVAPKDDKVRMELAVK